MEGATWVVAGLAVMRLGGFVFFESSW